MQSPDAGVAELSGCCTIGLKNQPDDPLCQQEAQEAKEALCLCEKVSASWVDQTIQARWLQNGDRCSKMFYKTFKSLANSKQIQTLFDRVFDEAGNIATSWDEMENVASNFFKSGLGESAHNPDAEHVWASEKLLEVVTDTLMVVEKGGLNA